MKKIVLSFLVLTLVNYSYGITRTNTDGNNPVQPVQEKGAVKASEESQHSRGGVPPGTYVINQFDSIYFDVEQATSNGTTIEFPVLIHSDDVINALDFALKYDHTFLEYDTIINLTNYIEPLSYYNPNDSTIRLTSFSFPQPYTNDTPLVIVRFTLLPGNPGYFCSSDIDSVSAMLNGDVSAYQVTDCHVGLNDIPSGIPVNLYPNPASDRINIEVPNMLSMEIFDIQSRIVFHSVNESPIQKSIIDVSNFQNGSYVVKVTGKNFVSYKNFVVSK